MNERLIEKLDEETVMMRDKFGLYWNAHNYDNPDDGVDLEKFAQLIVKECAAKAWWAEQYDMGNGVPISKQIERHFGVEE